VSEKAGEKVEDARTPDKKAGETPPAVASIDVPKSAVVREVSPQPKTIEHTIQSPPNMPVVIVKPTRLYPENRFIRAFNGRNLDGWDGNIGEWRIRAIAPCWVIWEDEVMATRTMSAIVPTFEPSLLLGHFPSWPATSPLASTSTSPA